MQIYKAKLHDGEIEVMILAQEQGDRSVSAEENIIIVILCRVGNCPAFFVLGVLPDYQDLFQIKEKRGKSNC